MNERLKQLAEQAGVQITKPTNYATALVADGQQKALEKFVELIIQQCCKEIKHKSIELLDVDFADHYILRLKKYYGVE